MKRHAWLFALSLLLAFPAAAQVVRGYAGIQLDLRAGPDIGYPVVDLVPTGAPLYVHGCTVDWSWCDVSVYDERGWVAGDYIDYPYERRWVSVYDYGAVIGIPVVQFIIGDYWHDYYRYRPFYRDRDYWYDRRFAYHRVPRYPHDRRRFADAFHDQVRYGRYDRDYDHHYDRDRDRRYDRRHDHDGDRRYRDQVLVQGRVGFRGDEHKRRLAPTVARNAIPRGEQVRAYTPRQNMRPQRLGGYQPRADNRSFANNVGAWRGGGQPHQSQGYRAARVQGNHRGNPNGNRGYQASNRNHPQGNHRGGRHGDNRYDHR